MTTMSIGKAWQETVAFVAREGALLFPVALLFLSVPMAILQLMIPVEYLQFTPGQAPTSLPPLPGSVKLAMFVAAIVMLMGSLTVYALALRPGISVAEAIRLAAGRLLILLGVSVIAGFALLCLIGVAGLIGGLLALAVGQVGGVALAVALMAVVILYLSARLLPLSAVVIDRRSGVIASLKETLGLTRGQATRIATFIVISLVLIMVVQIAVQLVFGVVGALILGADGGRSLSDVAVALASGAANVYLIVMTARIYRQLEAA